MLQISQPALLSHTYQQAAVAARWRQPVAAAPRRRPRPPPAWQHRQQHRMRLQPLASAYTEPALRAIRCAQQQACRQGGMFVAPPHLVLGLLDVPGCEAQQLLAAAGLSAAAAEAALVDPELLLSSSRSMAAGDLHWAPDARAAMDIAGAAAQEQGLSAAGTPHLLLGVVSCGNAQVNALLRKSGVQVETFEVTVRQAASSCKEAAAPAAAQPASGAAAAAALVQQYRQHVSTKGGSGGPPAQFGTAAGGGAAAALGGNRGGSSSSSSSSGTANGGRQPFDPSVLVRTPEDDDIYE